MRELWIMMDSSLTEDHKKELIFVSRDYIDVIVVEKRDLELVKAMGVKIASSSGGDIKLVDESEFKTIEESDSQTLCVRFVIKDRYDEDRAVEAVLSRHIDYVIISCPDWKVIPLENLIAKIRGKTKLIAEVSSASEAKLASETLEIGSDGVLLKTDKVDEITSTYGLLNNIESSIELKKAKVKSMKQLGLGARACIDTCDLMSKGEGMLIGSHSSGLFLIQAEVEETPLINPRPFRVNAGAISLYVLVSKNITKYLSELEAGDEVLIIDREGKSRKTIIGRVKIERRPLTMVEAEIEGMRVKTIVQNAETIRFVSKKESISVSELKPGDEVLIHFKPGGRHFGVLVEEESLIER
jgi:3-dehydroquinate synthase II